MWYNVAVVQHSHDVAKTNVSQPCRLYLVVALGDIRARFAKYPYAMH